MYNIMDDVTPLKAAVEAAWEAVPDELCTKLMLSMPSKLQKVLHSGGAYIDM